jgi:hypothetical protein
MAAFYCRLKSNLTCLNRSTQWTGHEKLYLSFGSVDFLTGSINIPNLLVMRELVTKLLALLLAFVAEERIGTLFSVLFHIVIALRVTYKMYDWRHDVLLEYLSDVERRPQSCQIHNPMPMAMLWSFIVDVRRICRHCQGSVKSIFFLLTAL